MPDPKLVSESKSPAGSPELVNHSKSAFFCQIEDQGNASPPTDKNPSFLALEAQIIEKAKQTKDHSHKVLLKNDVFKTYILLGFVSLDKLPKVPMNHICRYTNDRIQKLVEESILSFDKIGRLEKKQYEDVNSSVGKLLSGELKLSEILEPAIKTEIKISTSSLNKSMNRP